MKLLSFTRLGKSGFGAVTNNGVIDLTGRLDPEINTIKDLITLKKGLYLINNLKQKEGYQLLKNLVEKNSALKSLALEILNK